VDNISSLSRSLYFGGKYLGGSPGKTKKKRQLGHRTFNFLRLQNRLWRIRSPELEIRSRDALGLSSCNRGQRPLILKAITQQQHGKRKS
jgi:hypothetical protein